MQKKVYDVIIIGGGPAGFTAAVYTTRALLNTLVITSLVQPPQVVLTDIIENYPAFPEGINGFDFIEKVKQQAIKFGSEVLTDDVVRIYKEENNFILETTNKNRYISKSVIIATGRRSKKLEVEGEDKFIGRGISYCAVCDAPLFKDKTVAVIGGGDTAFSESIYLSKFVKKLYLVHRKTIFRATKILQSKLLTTSNVETKLPYVVEKFYGSDYLEGIEIKNVDTQQVENLVCDGVFICIGHKPNTEFLKMFVELDKDGYVITDENLQTSQKGVFACGDCRKGSIKQVVYACADGAKAALSAVEYIETQQKGG